MKKYETPVAELTAFEMNVPIAVEYGDEDIPFLDTISKGNK